MVGLCFSVSQPATVLGSIPRRALASSGIDRIAVYGPLPFEPTIQVFRYQRIIAQETSNPRSKSDTPRMRCWSIPLNWRRDSLACFSPLPRNCRANYHSENCPECTITSYLAFASRGFATRIYNSLYRMTVLLRVRLVCKSDSIAAGRQKWNEIRSLHFLRNTAINGLA